MAKKKRVKTASRTRTTGVRAARGIGKDEEALVHDLAEATVLWAGYLADAAKAGYEEFSKNITQKNALTIGFENGLLKAAINGWAAAMFSSYDSLPASFKEPFIQILTSSRRP